MKSTPPLKSPAKPTTNSEPMSWSATTKDSPRPTTDSTVPTSTRPTSSNSANCTTRWTVPSSTPTAGMTSSQCASSSPNSTTKTTRRASPRVRGRSAIATAGQTTSPTKSWLEAPAGIAHAQREGHQHQGNQIAKSADRLFLRAHVHWHHGPEESVLDGLPVQLGVFGDGAGDHRQHHIVYRAAAGRANGARFGEGELGPEHAPLAGAGPVEGQVLQRRQQFGHHVHHAFEPHRSGIVGPQQGAVAPQCVADIGQPFGELRQTVREGVHEKGDRKSTR